MIPNTDTNNYLSALQKQFEGAEIYYLESRRLYNESLKTKDAIKIDGEFRLLQIAETSMNHLKKRLTDVIFEIEKLRLAKIKANQERMSNYSNLTGEDLTSMENKIKVALEDYQAKQERYNASVALGSGHARWAKNNLLPAVNTAKDYWEKLKQTLDEMRKSMQEEQSIDLTNLVVDEAQGEGLENSMPWKTVGLAVGALVVVIIITKVI